MRAALFRRKGPAHEVLSVEEVEAPAPGPGEVRVRVAVSGVNPTDWKERSGSGPLDGLPFKVPDQDGAGVVEAVGEGVDPRRVGERVWLYFAAWQRQFGTAAELCTLPADQAVPLPDGARFDLGASLGIPALTAHRCLFADGPVDGRTVLVQGGAGAVGHAAIELARWRGARVLATVSDDEKGALARAAGADVVVDYRREDAAERIRAEAPDGVDRIVEVALHHDVDLDRQVIAPHAAVSSYADGGPRDVQPAGLHDAERRAAVRARLHDARGGGARRGRGGRPGCGRGRPDPPPGAPLPARAHRRRPRRRRVGRRRQGPRRRGMRAAAVRRRHPAGGLDG